MKNTTILKAARKLIKNEKHTFICRAIESVDPEKGTKLVPWIMGMLQGCYTFSTWLEKKHNIQWSNISGGAEKLRKTRLAWMDWMITYWAAEEAKEERKAQRRRFEIPIRIRHPNWDQYDPSRSTR